MKKLLYSIVAIFALTVAANASPSTVIFGGSTNQVYVGAVTNNNGVLVGATTNSFNLNSASGIQASTNLWPSASFAPGSGYPNTLYGPYRQVNVVISGGATNSPIIPVVFATSQDGTIWISNSITLTAVANTPFMTNFDSTAIPYYSVQSIAVTNVGAITNLIIEVSGKPGL